MHLFFNFKKSLKHATLGCLLPLCPTPFFLDTSGKAAQTQSRSISAQTPALRSLLFLWWLWKEKVTCSVIYPNVQFSSGSRLVGCKWQVSSAKRGPGRQWARVGCIFWHCCPSYSGNRWKRCIKAPRGNTQHPGIAQDQEGAGGHLFAGLNRSPYPQSPLRTRLFGCTCAVRMRCIYIGVRYGRSQCDTRKVDLLSCCAAALPGRGL